MEYPLKPVLACPRFIGNNPTIQELWVAPLTPAQDSWSYTVVFEREDLPDPTQIGNTLFQIYHSNKWHRKADIETFYYSSASQLLSFPTTYSDCCYLGAFSSDELHQTKSLPLASFTMYNEQAECPIIYVSTWNHSFCERDTNRPLLKIYNVPETNYPILQGTREDAEAKWKDVLYTPCGLSLSKCLLI